MAKVKANAYIYDDEAATVRHRGAEFECCDAYASQLSSIGAVEVVSTARTAAKAVRRKAAAKKGA